MRIAPRMPEVRAGYRKSAATRAAILAAAMAAFGEQGYAGATTRQIAEAAGVTLPAIAYHFGGKEGLHLACAEAIVERYRNAAADLVATGTPTLGAVPPDRDTCRRLLGNTLGMLLRLFLAPGEGQAQADFAIRALRERGAAFDLLKTQLWEPGIEATALLVAGARGTASSGDADRADALMLISSLLAFGLGADTSMALIARDARTPEARLDMLDGAIARRIEAL